MSLLISAGSLHAQPMALLVEQAREGPRRRAQFPRVVMDDVEMSLDAEPSQAQGVQPPRRQLSANGVDGDERHAKPSDDALLDRLGVPQLHAGAGRDAGLLERTLHDSTGGRPF